MADAAKVAADQAAADKAAAANKAAQDKLNADKLSETAGEDIKTNTVELGSDAAKDAVKQRLDNLSKHNEEGHAKNMAKIEEAAKGNDPDHPKIDPNMGREDNGCTPVIDKHGNKSWHPPGVAGLTTATKV
jgi:hypothetical protein